MLYRTIVADPPWPMKEVRRRAWGGSGGRRRRATAFPYQTTPIEWIKQLPVGQWAESDAHLYLWVPAKLNREGLGVRTATAWGFKVLSEIVWKKRNFGLGAFPRPQHEILLVCRRGKLPFRLRNIGSVQEWPHLYHPNNGGKRHSGKPHGAYNLIEAASPGPYLELFARDWRPGWDAWGDEAPGAIPLEIA
jgi:N6-adenosine-specific RNA methylase IME4